MPLKAGMLMMPSSRLTLSWPLRRAFRMVAGASKSVVSAFDGSLVNCPTTSLIAPSVAPSAPSWAIPSSSPGGNSTPTVMGSEEVSVVTVGSRFVNALMTPSGLVRSALKTPEIADESAPLRMFYRLAAVSVKRSDHASTSWTGRTCTPGGGAATGVTAMMLAPTKAIPAVA